MKNLTSYQLACGSVQREEINGHWVELYKESNCYHVRKGEIGQKWSEWESHEKLVNARQEYSGMKKEIKNLREYLYIVDLDERGEFLSHVENKNTGKVIFELCSDVSWLIEAGYMKHNRDISGLESWMKNNKLIEKESVFVK